MAAHFQTWPLSKTANKLSGACSVCHEIRQLHIKDNTVHQHGPRKNPCLGSHKPPLGSSIPAAVVAAAQSHHQAPVLAVDNEAVASSLSTLPNTSGTPTPPAATFSHPHATGGLIKHIPKSARPACATLLATLLRKVTSTPNDLVAWKDLLHFAPRVLHKPARTGKRYNLASTIKKRTEEVNYSSSDGRTDFMEHRARKRSAEELLAAAVAAKIEDGNIKAAIRMLSSEEKPATDVDATYAKLLERHPVPPADRLPAPDPRGIEAIQVTEEDVLKAVRTFPAGSAGGPDGLRPQHLLDLLNCRESGPALLTSLTAFTNMLLEGKCDPAVAPVLFGGQLIALEKRTGGIRPIAIGYTLRRVAAKCANAYATAVLADYLQPIQVGVGTPGGCEAAVHATRRLLLLLLLLHGS